MPRAHEPSWIGPVQAAGPRRAATLRSAGIPTQSGLGPTYRRAVLREPPTRQPCSEPPPLQFPTQRPVRASSRPCPRRWLEHGTSITHPRSPTHGLVAPTAKGRHVFSLEWNIFEAVIGWGLDSDPAPRSSQGGFIGRRGSSENPAAPKVRGGRRCPGGAAVRWLQTSGRPTVWRVRDSEAAGTGSQLLDSNQRPTVYETVALPTELSWLGRRGSRPIPPVLTSPTWPSNTTFGRGSGRGGGRFENLEPGGGRPWKGRSATGRVHGCFDGRPSETCSWPVQPGCSWWPFG